LQKLSELLNPEQKRAVEHIEGPLLILAGAGSGKTRVITYRIANLIENYGVSPYNILAITFTNKAAEEMKERVNKLVPDRAGDVWVSTFHSACVRILRREAEKIGYQNDFIIFDAGDQLSVIKECLKRMNLDEKKFPTRGIAYFISSAKSKLMDPDETLAKSQGDFKEEVYAEVYKLYQDILKANNALDFDDLIGVTVNLFKQRPDVLSKYQERFKYILVDEYQDTNYVQYLLIKLLAERYRNLCVVGDDDQSIYQWRGADIRNILSFEKDYPDTKVIKLEQNYRSTKIILDAANSIITNNRGRKSKSLWTERLEGEKLKLYAAPDEHSEAYFIANTISDLGVRYMYNEIAVLYRVNSLSRVIEDVLVRKGIPYTVVGGTRFYERKEIKDVLAYLRLIANPRENISLRRIINMPKRGIGKTTLDALDAYSISTGMPIYELLKSPESVPKLSRIPAGIAYFIDLIEGIRAQMADLTVSQLVKLVIERSGLADEYKNEGTLEALNRLDNMMELVSVAVEFENNYPDLNITEFLADISLQSDIDELKGDNNAVTLMTLHSAKGLEFPVVFIAGMEEGLFPHSRSFFEPEEMEEERRLSYVGVTRAQDLLYLTYAKQRNRFGQLNFNSPSRFLEEIPEELFEQDLFTEEQEIRVDYSVGDLLRHDKWGMGKVLDTRGTGPDQELSVEFPQAGIKHLMVRFAPITKVSGSEF
jgi:DNA helicase-2/ATP-dependent DNA helicase PcrA